MDASQYKDYILTLLFLKYVSDKYSGDRGLLRVPAGASFADIAKLKGKRRSASASTRSSQCSLRRTTCRV